MSPRTGAVIVAMTGALGSGGAEAQCRAAPDAPRLDHVVIAVRDLDAATAPFAAGGFRLKPGRLHANNLLNRHIKFSNGTSLEFMSVRGAPRDRMARDYADLIQAGEGGVLVALAIASAARVAEAARAWGEALQRSTSGPWSFVSFPHTSPAAAVFFSAGGSPANDPDSLMAHPAGVRGIAEVWVEGGAALGNLLESLGAARCGAVVGTGETAGTRFSLANGTLVVVDRRGAARPRVLGLVLDAAEAPAGVSLHPAVWIEFRGRRPEPFEEAA